MSLSNFFIYLVREWRAGRGHDHHPVDLNGKKHRAAESADCYGGVVQSL